MAINFDTLPTTNPYDIAPGIYRARITEAKMVASKTPGNPPYLSLVYTLLTKQGKTIGKIFDRITESTHQAVLYKVGRLINAVGVSLTGNVELKDLAKILPNKMLCIELTKNADNRFPDDRTKDRTEPRMFGSEIFWPIAEAERLILDEGAGEAAADAHAAALAAAPAAVDGTADMDDEAAALAREIAEAAGTDPY